MRRGHVHRLTEALLRAWDRVVWAVRKRGIAGAFVRAVGARRKPLDPDRAYAAWRHRNEPPGIHVDRRVGAPVVVIVPAGTADPAQLERTATSLRAQTVEWRLVVELPDADRSSPAWRWAERCALDPRITVGPEGVGGTELAGVSEIAVLVAPGIELAPFALAALVAAAREDPGAELLYGDEDRIGPGGARCAPCFKPAFSPDLLRSTPYLGSVLAFRPTLARRAGGLSENLQDVALRFAERAARVGHVPHVLHHVPDDVRDDDAATAEAIAESLRRAGEDGQVERIGAGRFRVRYRIRGQPLVTVIVPTRDRAELLRNALASVLEYGGWTAVELLVVDNGSVTEEARRVLGALRPPHRVLPWPGAFDWAAMNNEAARLARGEVLLFLNNDVEAIHDGWLVALLEHAQRSGVGPVGAKLLYPDGTVQHAGVALGMEGFAGHAFRGAAAAEPGPCGGLIVVRNCSAVTGACLMIRREVFDSLGGFDPELRIGFNDVDLCLRAAEAGARTVWTPHATLVHHESATRSARHPRSEYLRVRARWGERSLEGDPYVSAHLDLDRAGRAIRVG